jgi:hypothetical protein
MNSYDHVLHVDADSREIRIYRMDSTGEQSLYTSVKLPESLGWTPELESFARQLGENLLLDSPAARKMLGL